MSETNESRRLPSRISLSGPVDVRGSFLMRIGGAGRVDSAGSIGGGGWGVVVSVGVCGATEVGVVASAEVVERVVEAAMAGGNWISAKSSGGGKEMLLDVRRDSR